MSVAVRRSCTHKCVPCPGELEKFVHVSPQRFGHVLVKGSAPCGLTISVKGSSGEKINLVAVDPKGIVHISTVTIPSSGSVDVAM